MAEVVPFHGLRYDESKAGPLSALISPPYDVISDALREELYGRSAHNFVRVEWGKDEEGDTATNDRYTRAHASLTRWLERGILRVDHAPAFYLYDQYFELAGERVRRRGFFGALRLYQEGRGIVRPHEHTFPKAKSDRLRLLAMTRVNTSPVFGMYDDARGEVATALDRWMAAGPARLVADTHVGTERHLVWALDDKPTAAKLRDALKDKRIYIADGHHRYETALEYAAQQHEEGHVELQEDSVNYVLTFLTSLDDPGLRIFPTHRIVRGARAAVDAAIARSFETAPADPVGPLGPRGLVLARDGALSALRLRPDADLSQMPEAWRALPVAHAELILGPAREAGAEISYEHDAEQAIAAAREGADAVLVEAVSARTLQRVADAWQRLPQKTTYFYPKVPAGLVLRPLGD
ncbi:MAG TPA: DUF1015 domain-containing protein [Candidatus Limnocylindria bacterium]|nr:DUF1015 domain-containing protein [Candidatus Limnocylindria bacterium]